MANTTNLNLVKPAGTDYALVSVINGNMDIIDSKVGAVPSNASVQGQIDTLNNQMANFGKVLWEGTKFISGELTVSGMSNYRIFIFMYSNTAPLIAIINSGIMWCGMQYGQYNAPGILGLAARYAYSSDKLTINQMNRGLTDGTNTNYDGNLTDGIVKIIGIA